MVLQLAVQGQLRLSPPFPVELQLRSEVLGALTGVLILAFSRVSALGAPAQAALVTMGICSLGSAVGLLAASAWVPTLVVPFAAAYWGWALAHMIAARRAGDAPEVR